MYRHTPSVFDHFQTYVFGTLSAGCFMASCGQLDCAAHFWGLNLRIYICLLLTDEFTNFFLTMLSFPPQSSILIHPSMIFLPSITSLSIPLCTLTVLWRSQFTLGKSRKMYPGHDTHTADIFSLTPRFNLETPVAL